MPRPRSSALDKPEWVHHRGGVNLSTWTARAVCGECRYRADHAEDVEQYRPTRVW